MANVYLIILILTLAGCSLAEDTQEPRFGLVPMLGQFPSAVSVQVQNHACTGTILDASHVITSTRCVVNATFALLNPIFIRIVAGDLSIGMPNFGRFTTTVTHIYAHPEFNPMSGLNDLSVLRVAIPFPLPHNTIDIGVRNTLAVSTGTACQFAGWGSQTQTGPIGNQQSFLNINIVPREQCNNIAGVAAVNDNMICAGEPVITPSLCVGTIGGGLFCNGLLTGVLTLGAHCGQAPLTSALFTQVRSYEPWIQTQFTRTDSPPLGQQVAPPPVAPLGN